MHAKANISQGSATTRLAKSSVRQTGEKPPTWVKRFVFFIAPFRGKTAARKAVRRRNVDPAGQEKAHSQLRVSVSRGWTDVERAASLVLRACRPTPPRYYLFDRFTSYPAVSSRSTDINTHGAQLVVGSLPTIGTPDKLFHAERRIVSAGRILPAIAPERSAADAGTKEKRARGRKAGEEAGKKWGGQRRRG